jgi:hypothetical protein
MPELSKRKIYGHDIFVKLKAFIDFKTVYDTDTVEHSIKPIVLVYTYNKVKLV